MNETFTIGVEVDSSGALKGLKDLQDEIKKTNDEARKAGKSISDSFASLNDVFSNVKGGIDGLRGGLQGTVQTAAELSSAYTGATSIVVGFATAAAGLTLALISNANEMAAAADAADELADKMGVTREQLATLQLIADENAGSVEGLVGVYDKLSRSLTKVEDDNLKVTNAFRALGIAETQLAGLTREQIAGIVIKNYEALGRSAEAVAAAGTLLGTNFRNQIPSIKAAADGIDDYARRVRDSGVVASDELVAAGGRQEKALNNLRLEFNGLRNDFATGFTEILTLTANWATEMLKEYKRVSDGLPAGPGSIIAKAAGAINIRRNQVISEEEISQIEKSAKKAADLAEDFNIATDITIFNLRKIPKYYSELNKQLKEYEANLTNAAKAETARLAGRYPAPGSATPKPLPPLKPPPKGKTDQEKGIDAFYDALLKAETEMQKAIAVAEQFKSTGINPVEEAVTALTYKLFEAGKGFYDLETAAAFARNRIDDVRKSIQATNDINLAKSISANSQDLQNQIELLKTTNEVDRGVLAIEQNLNKITGKQYGLQTPEQLAAIKKAADEARQKLQQLQDIKIDKNASDALKNLSLDLKELTQQNTEFWETNKNGLSSIRQATLSLYRSIDPEGLGENISNAQKLLIEGQLQAIQRQKELLEFNRKIEQSFSDLGSAVADWALGSEGAIRKVKVELIKLIALEALKRANPGGILGTFLGGFVSGLSGARAEGGPVTTGNSYLVGEKGPEIFTARQSGYIIPNNRISMSTGKPVNVVFSPNLIIQGSVTGQSELDRAFEEFATAQAQQVQQFILRQAGQNGILRAR